MFGLFGDGGLFGGSSFSCTLKGYPVAYMGREDLEIGNRMLLPPSAMERLSQLNVPSPMLFEVSDFERHRKTHAGVLEFVAPEETCYLPSWILRHLGAEDGDVLHVQSRTLPKATYIKFRPASVALLRVFNPRALLENGLRNYTSVTEGDSFAVEYNGRSYGLEVVETRPQTAVCILDADVEVDFATPKDIEAAAAGSREHSPTINATLTTAPTDTPAAPARRPQLFDGAGHRIDGLQPVAREEASNCEEVDEMPWKQRIPKGVKWTSPPYGYQPLFSGGGTSVLSANPSVSGLGANLSAGGAHSTRPLAGSEDEDAIALQRARVLNAATSRETEQADAIAERRRLEVEERARKISEEAAKDRALEESRRKRAAAAAAAMTPRQIEMGGGSKQPPEGESEAVPSGGGRSACCGCFGGTATSVPPNRNAV
eukprot:TRINITY_DN31046_c0_g1_i1.p1 TRINITY_DN31046_c0_g1~~TRINITY_DN31046_c0_g1_i1.p1  ORF type:complete len:429 (+),score=78.80 TRINITY_DN31046_c0_g1_i1:119-1405(+)